MKRILLVAFGATLLALGGWGMASAHATLDHCTPAVGSTVASAPAQIVCVYSEEIDTKRSTMSVWDANGGQVDKQDAHVDLNDPNHATLIVSLDTGKTPNGLYTLKWHAVTPDDNGISDGSWQFVIGSANATPYPPTIEVQGETPAAVSPTAASVASAATPSATAVAAVSAATATVAASAAPQPSPTPAAPATAPATGAPGYSVWLLFALLGLALLLGGTALRFRRR